MEIKDRADDAEESFSNSNTDSIIQIIDDDKIIRSMLTKVLQKSGYQVLTSENGKDGLAQYQKQKPDLVLLDVLMPEMDGYEVCLELRKLEGNHVLPVLMLTGLDDVVSVSKAFSAGATDFVTKPINLALLRERVKYALKGRDMYYEIQRQSNELNAILYSASDGIVTTDMDGIVLDANPAAEKLFGCSKEEMINQDFMRFIDFTKITDYDMGQDKTGGIENINIRLAGNRVNGESFPMEYNVNTISIGELRIKSYFLRDLTERLKIERLKGEFIQTVSHELRTPIAAIKGAVGILASGILGELPEDVQELVNIPQKACRNLENLVDDILDVTTLEDVSESVNYEVVSLRDILEKMISNYQDFAADNEVQILYENDSDIQLNTDSRYLYNTLKHLMSNAIKFSQKQDDVRITVLKDKDSVKISVSDNGIGISDNDKQNIFSKFSQIDNSSTRKQGGTGLGLYIAKTSIEKLGGSLSVESVLGQGSTFVVSLAQGNVDDVDVKS